MMDEKVFASFVLYTLKGELSEALRHRGAVLLANHIYNECYPGMNDLSNTSHYVAKASEIAEWLENGDLQDATLEGLVAEWKGYDSQEEEGNDE